MVNDLTARQGARSRVLRSLALVAAFGLAVTGLAATATTATAADNASISGTVTATAGGAPIEDATVTVHAGDAGEDDGLWSPFATAVTGADGAYSVTDLPAGLYRVEFRAAGYAREYWQNVDEFWDSTVVTLTGGENRGSIDASLADAGSVSGTVTAEGGTPVSGAEVAFYSEETDGDETYWSNYIEVTTGDDGSYTMPNLPSGDYRVSFRAYGFLEEYWDGATTLDAGDDVSVTVGGTTSGIDAVLDDGAKIKGTVTLPGGAPAVGHSVVAWAVNDDWGWTTYAEIAADGSYTLSGLLPGPYTVRFYASHESPYVTAYYGGEVFEGDATTFTLGADTTKTGIDHEFVTGATVQGTVTVPGGAAAADTYVTLYRVVAGAPDNPYYNWEAGYTAESGTFSFRQLPAGTYTLMFDDEDDDAVDEFPRQYLGGRTDRATSATFTVAAGASKTVDYTLQPAASLDKVATSTSLTLSKSVRPFGTASTATIAVAGGTGTARLYAGSKLVAIGTLSGGKTVVTIPRTFAVGGHILQAKYFGSGSSTASASGRRAFKVTKAAPKVSAKLTSTTIRKSSRGKVAVAVTAPGTVPAGTVTIKKGSKVVGSAKLVRGKITIKLAKLGKGTHKLRAVYGGSGTALAAASGAVTLTVRS